MKEKFLKIITVLIPLALLLLLFVFIMDKTSPDNKDVDELAIEDIIIGDGEEVKIGDKVKVNYIGTLLNGTEFDNSYTSGSPFEFTVGSGEVIKGWDEGIVGMKVGGKRKLTIPSSLAYGEKGSGDKIPPNSGLVFEIDLVEIVVDTVTTE